MPIPFAPKTYVDVEHAFSRIEELVRAAVGRLPDTPAIERKTLENREPADQRTEFGVMKRVDTYVIDGGEGRRSEVEVTWMPQRPIDWTIAPKGPGGGGGCVAGLVGVAVVGLWVAWLVSSWSYVFSLRGRAIVLILMGGVLGCLITAGIAVAIAMALLERSSKLLFPAKWRAASAFTAEQAQPAITEAMTKFAAEVGA